MNLLKPAFRLISYLVVLGGWGLSGCDFKLPSPPPDLFYKFNTLPTGNGPASILATDLDKDGYADIVSANAKDSTLSVFYGNGDGTFAQALSIRVPAEPTYLALGNMNADEFPDLLVNARGADLFSVLPGNKDREFKKLMTQKTGRVPLSLIPGDYNNDGIEDVAVTLTFDKVEIHMGWGNGRFKHGETYQSGSRSFSGVAEDFDRDGNQDIALAASSATSSSIRIFRGRGDGTFEKPSQIAQGLVPLVLVKKDMNSDGLTDLVCASGKGDNLYMFYSKGDGTFGEPIGFSGGGGPLSLATEDFNDDHLIDAVIANSRSSSFSLAVRKEDGLFHYPTRDYVVDGGTPLAIASADFNDDGMTDVAVASNAKNTVEVYLRRKIFK